MIYHDTVSFRLSILSALLSFHVNFIVAYSCPGSVGMNDHSTPGGATDTTGDASANSKSVEFSNANDAAVILVPIISH